ncbi:MULTISPECIES: DUF3240 family protein [Massilia]|uniref:DUF3240 domain-containing protein n=1 Tax=Massilia timonae TaxID=47229 RepID=A0A1S2N4W0_9BURK|nr:MULTISPECIES: DUF3240 family protein [Massilia]OIJ39840.1 hypothetical protein LO55_3256 [Massilia timonae]
MKTDANDTLLTLAIPVGLEEDIIDFLLLHPKWAGGFTILGAQGAGQGARLQSPMELVQGRSARKLILIGGLRTELDSLLAALAADIPSPEVSYWMSPIIASGRLA